MDDELASGEAVVTNSLVSRAGKKQAHADRASQKTQSVACPRVVGVHGAQNKTTFIKKTTSASAALVIGKRATGRLKPTCLLALSN